jgi:hypothetical protein
VPDRSGLVARTLAMMILHGSGVGCILVVKTPSLPVDHLLTQLVFFHEIQKSF